MKSKVMFSALLSVLITGCAVSAEPVKSEKTIPELETAEQLRNLEDGIVFIYSDECGVCEEVGPELENYYRNHQGSLWKFNLGSLRAEGNLSLEEATAFCEEFQLEYYPVLMRFENSELIELYPDYSDKKTVQGTDGFIEYVDRFLEDVSG